MHGKSGISGRNASGVPQMLACSNSRESFFLISSLGFSARRKSAEDERTIELMLRAIVAVLLILWLLGFVLHIAGGVIHLLAVIAVVVLIYDLVAHKKPVS
jgi:hypothetical protein